MRVVIHGLVVLFVLSVAVMGSDFMPMTPVGAECIPVSFELTGCAQAGEALRLLTFDTNFSGLLEVADHADSYARAECSLTRGDGVYTLSTKVYSSDGEMLLSKEYTGYSWESLVHYFSDDLVYLLTGEQGIASTKLAFVSRTNGRYSLEVHTIDSRAAQTVMADNEVITTPSWSPDGNYIAFTSFRNHFGDVYLYSFSNSSARKIISGGLNTCPAWAPDSKYMAFTKSVAGTSDIYTVDIATGNTSRLTSGRAIETSASFSPTGQQIILTSDRVGYPQLYIMDSSGGTAGRASFAHGYCDSPAWSPDGDRIAYCARVGGNFHIFVMNSDGTDIRQVTTEGSLNEDPVWSPTGRHLAFSSNRDGTRSIYLLELNKLLVYRLTDGAESYCPTWSPVTTRRGTQ